MVQLRPTTLSLEDFLTQYADDPRYELDEYWIVDFRGLGGVQFIGRPKQPSLTVCQLQAQDYEKQIYRLGQKIRSLKFPEIQLQLDDLMP